MKRVFCFIALLFFFLQSFSQGSEYVLPDSLQFLLDENVKSNSKRCEALQTVVDAMHEQQQYQASLPYVKELENLSNTLNDDYLKAVCNYYYGAVSWSEDDYDNAFDYLFKAKELAKTLPKNDKSLTLKVRIQIVLGACYLKTMKLPQAYQSLQEGIELNKALGNQYLQFKLDNNLLVTYRYLGLQDEIAAINRKMLANPTYSGYNKYMNYFSMARYYLSKKCYDTTEMYLDTALIYSQKPTFSAWIYLYHGIMENERKAYDKAIVDFDNGLATITEENNLELQSNLLINKGLSHALSRNDDQALALINSGIALAKEKEILYLQRNGLHYKCEILYEIGDYKQYAETSRILRAIEDSLDATKDLDKLKQLELEHLFDMAKEQLEQAQLLKEMQEQRSRMILYLIIGALVFAVLMVTLLLNRNKILLKNKELQKEAMAHELDLRNRELTAKALVQSQRQEILTDIVEKLTAVQNDKKKMSDSIQSIINDFKQYRNAQTPEDFDYYFTQTHPDFYKKLSHDFPDLTPYETHLCAYIRLNLNTKDIAEICGIEPSSVRMARHRLRKSLGITDSDTDLIKFLSKY